MAIYTGWKVLVGGFDTTTGVTNSIPNDAIDFTSRLRSFSHKQEADFGKVGQADLGIRLDNSDGAFTPAGGGTYESFDWFGQPIFLIAQVDTSDPPTTDMPPLFTGVISQVDFYDDGFDSYLDVDASDWLTFLARYTITAETDYVNAAQPLYVPIQDFINNITDLPTFGAASVGPAVNIRGVAADFIPIDSTGEIGDYAGDLIDDLAVAEHGVILPPRLVFSTNTVTYTLDIFPRGRLGQDATVDDYTFKQTGDIGSGDLPFRTPTIGFDVDYLVNLASVNAVGGDPQIAENTTTQGLYGPRSAKFEDIEYGFDSTALDLAQFLVTRFDTVTFGIRSIDLTGKLIRANTPDGSLAAVRDLLTGCTLTTGALYRYADCRFDGAGGIPVTSQLAFFTSNISGSVDEWAMRLDAGRSALTSFGFRLGSSTLGVLGTNKVS